MQRRDDLPPINFSALAEALLARAETLVPLWLQGGNIVGHEYVCAGLGGGAGRSCSVNLTTGAWADFSGDDKGSDLLSLYAAIHGLPSQGKAARQVAEELGLESIAGIVKGGNTPVAPAANPRPALPPKAAPPKKERETWTPIVPVPGHAPAPTFWHHERKDPAHTACYVVAGAVYGYVVRFIGSDGRKITMPYVFARSDRDGSCKWVWRGWDEPRPLYYPGGQPPGGRRVVLVEGEIKGEVLQSLLDATDPGRWCVASWPNGSKSWHKADWSWLAGCDVLLWPDCDAKRERLSKEQQQQTEGDAEARAALEAVQPLLPEAKQPGMAAMLGIGALLRDTHGGTVGLLPIPAPGERPDGWDARDAIETDGWTGADVLAFFDRSRPLLAAADAPAGADADPPAAGKAAQGKKRGGPVGTGAGGDGKTGGKAGPELVPPRKGTPAWLEPYWDWEKARWLVSRRVVIDALENDPDLAGVVAYNELTNSIQCRRAWPWPHAKPGDVRNADALLLGKYLTDTYGLPAISRASLDEAIQTVAEAERYHPIREWLIGLQWDGTPRLGKWLLYVLGETPQSINARLFEYLGLVGRYWLQGMVWRVMEPGCKFDYCPVLEGAGGLRKSTLVEVLASSAFFSDTPFDMSHGKEAQEQVQGVWAYEIAELAAMSKADVNAIKAFISSKVDRYRVAYGATVESFPRQCVLVGTTNEDTYLRDRTGNRRWWPVPVRHQINTEWVQRWREQLFAEAFALYLQGEAYTPSPDQEQRLFRPMQDSRLVETAVESELLRVLTRRPGGTGILEIINIDAKFVTIAQIVTALGIDAAKSTPGLEGQIRGWLKQAGWTHGKQRINGTPANGYKRPEVWPPKDAVAGLDEEPADVPAEQAGQDGPGAADAAPSGDSGPPVADYFGEGWDEPF
ncbi:virulence protein E [Corticibacter populi]|uniref:Virulence protein E n=1 Tax=Corticibacter populi TaxID=1550736 RepID=A0A3M6QUL9_9BURK|nr:VapE domain-containing protein [Corticibacter populi]RMX06727.1 virulence protein E [Corticibacter populi]RZS31692.1 putative P-loop ATPase [Corticibacter populi]